MTSTIHTIQKKHKLKYIFHFLKLTGFRIEFAQLPENQTFLPGISIFNGTILVDKNTLLYTGDVLLAAGCLAIMPATVRHSANTYYLDTHYTKEQIQSMAIAWSYAACVEMGINPLEVFGTERYNGCAEELLKQFLSGSFNGLNLLRKAGFCHDTEDEQHYGAKRYPYMMRWIAD